MGEASNTFKLTFKLACKPAQQSTAYYHFKSIRHNILLAENSTTHHSILPHKTHTHTLAYTNQQRKTHIYKSLAKVLESRVSTPCAPPPTYYQTHQKTI